MYRYDFMLSIDFCLIYSVISFIPRENAIYNSSSNSYYLRRNNMYLLSYINRYCFSKNKKLLTTSGAFHNKTTNRDLVQSILLYTQLNVEFYLNIGFELANNKLC